MRTAACSTVAALLATLALQGSARAQADEDRGSVYVVAHVDIAAQRVPGQAIPDFLKAMGAATAEAGSLLKQLAGTCRKDAGCQSFEILQQIGGPNHFTLVEAWTDAAAFEAHEATPEVREIRAKLQPILGSPFDERRHHVLP